VSDGRARDPADLPTAGLLRRLGAALYDLILVLALMMVATALLLPLTGGRAITPTDSGAVELAYQALLLTVVTAFFVLFWTWKGQTLGMAAWRLKVVRSDGRPLALRDALRRFVVAPLAWLPCGLGVLWILFDREHLAWHDRLSGTRIVRWPGRAASS